MYVCIPCLGLAMWLTLASRRLENVMQVWGGEAHDRALFCSCLGHENNMLREADGPEKEKYIQQTRTQLSAWIQLHLALITCTPADHMSKKHDFGFMPLRFYGCFLHL